MKGMYAGRNLGNVWTKEREKEWKEITEGLVFETQILHVTKGRGFALCSALKHGSTASLEKRDLSFYHAIMEHGHGVMWRFRKPGNTTAVFVFFALVFSLYSLNNCRVRALLDSFFCFRKGPLIFLSFWGQFCVELTYLSCFRGLWTAVLWWSCDGQSVVREERNIFFAAAIGLRLSFCRSWITKSPLRSNGVWGVACTCQFGTVALGLILRRIK